MTVRSLFHSLALVTTCLLLAAVSASAQSSTHAPTQSSKQPLGTVTFYSSMVLNVVAPIIQEFENRHPEVNIDLNPGGCGQHRAFH